MRITRLSSTKISKQQQQKIIRFYTFVGSLIDELHTKINDSIWTILYRKTKKNQQKFNINHIHQNKP